MGIIKNKGIAIIGNDDDPNSISELSGYSHGIAKVITEDGKKEWSQKIGGSYDWVEVCKAQPSNIIKGELCDIRIGSIVVKKNSSGQFEILSDNSYKPMWISNIETNTSENYQFSLSYPYSFIGSVVATPDKRLAEAGLFIGVDITKTEARFSIYRNGFTKILSGTGNNIIVRNYLKDIVKSNDITTSWDATNKELTISHPNIQLGYDDKVIVTRDEQVDYIPIVKSFDSTSAVISFYDNDGNLKDISSKSVKFNYHRTGTWLVPIDNIPINAKINIQAIMVINNEA